MFCSVLAPGRKISHAMFYAGSYVLLSMMLLPLELGGR